MAEMSTIDSPLLLTVTEVAEQLRVSVPTVRRWIRSGELDAVRLGCRPGATIRVPRAAVDNLLDLAKESA